jgi:hypothetical protein
VALTIQVTLILVSHCFGMIIRPSVVTLFTSSTTALTLLPLTFSPLAVVDIARCRWFGLPPPRGWIVQIVSPFHNCTRLGPTIPQNTSLQARKPLLYIQGCQGGLRAIKLLETLMVE